ncbi:MAG: hypothetical protein E7591_02670 [Ruminococcaceae bacterium]|nr:hypothetical protein [Oscillospiraceae bacterium]
MKRVLCIITAILLIIAATPVSFAESGVKYTDIGNKRARLDKAEIVDGTALCDIDAQGLTIVELGREIFAYLPVESIEFPKGLEKIGYSAFLGCDKLESVEIPLTVRIIDTYAFSECYSLESVTIPETVEYIGEWAFDFGDLEVKVYEGSYAEEYCIVNGFDYILADKDCPHSEKISVITEYAACEYTGEEAEQCVACGKLTNRTVIKAKGHDFGLWSFEEGVRARECKSCGNSFEGFEREYTELPFTDVSEKEWYFESVRFCYTNSLVKGTSASSFAPKGSTTRAAVVQILSQYAGADLSAYTDSKFIDVSPSDWYAPCTAWAGENGIVNGNEKGEFMPKKNVSREQLTVILKNFADFMGYEYAETYTDVAREFSDADRVASWAKESMDWAVSLKIVNGVGAGKLDPKGLASRGQIAKMTAYFADIFEPETLYGYDRVVVFMIDGAGNFFKDAKTANIDKIFDLTAVSRASGPVNCMSERASVLTGTDGSVHGISHRDDAARDVYNERNGIKTFLGEVKEKYPEKEVACFASSLEISQLAEEEGGVYAPIDENELDNVVTDILCNEGGYLENNDPSLLFVEMRQVLQGGVHFEGGFGSSDYLMQLSLTDGYIGRIYNKYEELGRNENTLYLLITDHGGVIGGSSYTGDSDDELNSFIGIGGKGVNKDADLTGFSNTDLYGIILDVFGIDRPYTSISSKYNDLFIGE